MNICLYDYYRQSSLDAYGIVKHFTENYYLEYHSRNNAKNVLKAVLKSNKINKILKLSAQNNTVPDYNIFISAISRSLKFLFSSTDTHILATMGAVLRWDTDVNTKLNIISQEDLKEMVLKILQNYSVCKELTDNVTYSSDDSKQNIISDNIVPKTETQLEKSATKSKRTIWSLSTFSKQFDSMQIGQFTNSETGDIFSSCVFIKADGTKTFVSFSSKLGELTSEEIEEMKDKLAVIKSPSGHFSLTKTRRKSWKEVNI